MTTNYTHIFNDNIDMFDTTETLSLAQEAQEARAELEAQEAEDRFYNAFLQYEREVFAMDENAEGYAEAMAIYSDMYKDVYGYRPHGIGLRYHGL